jgi:hypothetical protein
MCESGLKALSVEFFFMANISYEVTRWDVSVHPEGRDDSGYVCKVILGVTATDSVSGFSSYKDETVTVHQPVFAHFCRPSGIHPTKPSYPHVSAFAIEHQSSPCICTKS